MNEENKNERNKTVRNYYQGVYLTETIMGNPNGDFIDNSPRNFDGKVFTTDKCIKYNVRKYIQEKLERIKKDPNGKIKSLHNFVFFYPRQGKYEKKDKKKVLTQYSPENAKFLEKDDIFEIYFNKKFEDILNNCPDVRMFGGTFSFTGSDNKQIYGPIQLSYGMDINDAQIKRLQIGAPFATKSGQQTTTGSEAVVDDAIVSYDITINPNNYPGLLKESDLELFKTALWYGTNLRKSTSKKTDSKLLILIKFKNSESNNKAAALNIGELKRLIKIKNKEERKRSSEQMRIEVDTTKLKKKLEKFKDYIEEIETYGDESEVSVDLKIEGLKIEKYVTTKLLSQSLENPKVSS